MGGKKGEQGYQDTAHALPSGPRGGQRGPQRDEEQRDAPGICDLTSAPCESLSEGRRLLRALPLPLQSEALGFFFFIKDIEEI